MKTGENVRKQTETYEKNSKTDENVRKRTKTYKNRRKRIKMDETYENG